MICFMTWIMDWRIVRLSRGIALPAMWTFFVTINQLLRDGRQDRAGADDCQL